MNTAGQIPNSLNDYVNRWEARGYFQGSLLVAQKGEILLTRGCGVANLQHDVANTPQTAFRIGSITKSFTAAAILQLCEQGKLSLDDTLDRFLPDFPRGERITVHQLLTHTAGAANFTSLPDYWGKRMRLPATLDEIVQLIKSLPPDFEPGKNFGYSNSGYILLSKIIETTSGLPYRDYIRERIAYLLGLENTGCDDGRTIVKNLAAGYTVDKQVRLAEPIDMSFPLGAYGMYSTVEDLFLWLEALRDGRAINRTSAERMFQPYEHGYGYGWAVDSLLANGKERVCYGHFGDINGFASDILYVPTEQVTVVVLSNFNLTPVMKMSRDLARITLGDTVEIPEAVDPIPLDPVTEARYTGVYRMEDRKGEIAINREGSELYITMPKQYGVPYTYGLIPVEQRPQFTRFVARFLDEEITFFHNQSGNVEKLMHTDVYRNPVTATKLTREAAPSQQG
ncbi:serine hydrolase domain-containing protein [Brevibacillus sp. H7]|uniref:serine hydrolase domain-containing protein n=1 Tax=Brevibacillus sp. H7 TaxID=3349138 RepID=UPI0038109A04